MKVNLPTFQPPTQALAMILAGLFVLPLLPGCVRSSIHQTVLDDLIKTREHIEQLQGDNKQLQKDNAKLNQEISYQKTRVTHFQNKSEGRYQDTDRLAKTNIEMSSEMANLTRQQEHLRQTIQAQTQKLEEMAQLTVAKEEEVTQLKSTYDQLVGELEGEIKKGEITITQVLDRLSVNMVEKILFASGSVEVKPAGLRILKRVGKILLKVSDKQIRVEGHTDNIPIGPRLSDRYPTNWELSAARSTHVVRYLLERVGLEGRLLSATGLADTRPVASNKSRKGRALNRRIEIVLLPLDMDRVLRDLHPSP